ncbi:MAG TPA: MerR family transcriptional regulator [Firmicutes bacterium]|nr:MerR family transcriptional regulator [Bacillota bacterium]
MNDRGHRSDTPNTHRISTQEVCRLLDISKRTLQNWEKSGVIPRAPRDWRGYRIFTEQDVEDIRRVIQQKAERNRAT